MPPYKIIIVDDDPDDRYIMDIAFTKQGSTEHLILSSAGEVITYLQSVVHSKDLPRLIITDLNMPGISGFDLLQVLKGMHRYRHIDVFVYSTSSLISHVNTCLALGAKEYIIKPLFLEDFQELAERLSSAITA